MFFFQTPLAQKSEWIFSYHEDLMFILISILMNVFYLLYKILRDYSLHTYNLFSPNVVHHLFAKKYIRMPEQDPIAIKHLELVWTIGPSCIIAFLIAQNVALAYADYSFLNRGEYALEQQDQGVLPLDMNVIKAVGRQWYWSYEFHVKEPSTTLQTKLLSTVKNLTEKYKIITWKIIKKWEISNILPSYKFYTFDAYMISTEDCEKLHAPRLLETYHLVPLPSDTITTIFVTSDDVIHSWGVPQLGTKIDATPGRLIQAELVVDFIGVVRGQCYELCGAFHAFMPIAIYAVPKQTYFFFTDIFFPSN